MPDTVERGIVRTSAISGPLNRSPPQRSDRLDPALLRAVDDVLGRRGAIKQPELALGPVARHPLRAGPLAHLGGRGREPIDQPCSITRETIRWRCLNDN